METIDKKTGEVHDHIAEHVRGLCGYNERGEELLDPRPVALPVGFERPRSLQETMRALIRNEEVRRYLDARGVDTFEEANDFGPDEDERDPFTGSLYQETDAIARNQEIRSGFVEEIPTERKEKARKVIEQTKRKAEEKSRPRQKAKPEKEAENGETEEETED